MSLIHTIIILLLIFLYIQTDASEFARITECSMRHLNFTLSETPGGTIAYYFQAACMDNNGNCVSQRKEEIVWHLMISCRYV